ncbi:MAG TPA: pilus assembly protein TadG-related protein [Candidatus Dormibacteraeota bacterium]|nr:pilus assembly protein TadG-related protein [Candidatus Dormibacteraeota bacterium]
MRRRREQSGQVMVIVAVWLVALIGSAALILLTGSVEWQRNQLQQLADQAALDAALKIGVGCTAGSASAVITEADTFVATQRTRTGSLAVGAGSCSGGYTGTDTFGTSLTETIHYPYRAHQQQVEVILSLSLPISFGSYMGASNTTVTRRAVAQQLAGSTNAVKATTLSCTGGQFNVGGSIATQNTITLSGSCAVYAHTRFDVTSGTYSDLGNVSVYASAQTWLNAGGACSAGANSGSSNAICADGSELSGHTTMTCGTSGTTAFLSAGDAAINPNPCAAGKAPQPAPPVAISLPPEPNTDPAAIATLQGTGGAACTAGAAMPNIQVSGVTVATGLGPVPTKDANNFYHFKPSCYGYLNPSLIPSTASITNRQIGAEVGPVRHFIISTLPVGSTAGTLLVNTIRCADGANTITGPGGGWTLAASAKQVGEGWNQIWYRANATAGITTAQWTVLPASVDCWLQMTEWNGVATAAPLDRTGTTLIGVPQMTATVSTSAAMTSANELALTSVGFANQGGGNTYAQGASWNSLLSDSTNGYGSEYRVDLGAVVASETVTYTSATTWSAAIASFKPGAGVAAAGAVLDPGFYYFNGNGFVGGGGGICLGGSTLLARDVTLEFVNAAGFNSATCAVGGGAGCAAGSCQFGSTPCSISVCPPNAPADSAGGGYTWFAAPCSVAPAGDASCPGSSWCPAGDRACWNLLIWAPAGSTAQIAIKGASAKHWLLGSVFWPGTCTDTVNGTSTIDGTISCATLSVSAAAGAGTAVGSDYGISTALVEAVLLE